MSPFVYDGEELTVDGVRVSQIAAEHGTPAFIYSCAAIREAYRQFAQASIPQPLTVCYALKANSNLGVIDCLNREGAGFDIVSIGELRRVLAAGGQAGQVVFSGVGKTGDEMREAIVAGVRCFNVESEPELRQLSAVATELDRIAPVSVRVNPDVDARTHPYISTGLRENKFGIAHQDVLSTYRLAHSLPGIRIVGIDCHIGSQITDLSPYLAAMDRLLDLVAELQALGIELEHIDLGGGLGVDYDPSDQPPARSALIQAISRHLHGRLGEQATRYELIFEFGRSIVANAGILLCQTIYLKKTDAKNFAIVDAAMNDLLRPTLYQARHQVLAVRQRAGPTTPWDLVGPICESGDWLAKQCELAPEQGDLLAISHAGAYAMVMSSNYNSRPRAPELMVDDGRVHVVRQRETIDSLFETERRLPS